MNEVMRIGKVIRHQTRGKRLVTLFARYENRLMDGSQGRTGDSEARGEFTLGRQPGTGRKLPSLKAENQ